MSQTFFSKLDSYEKGTRFTQLANLRGKITLWQKGSSEKIHVSVVQYDKERMEAVLDSKEDYFPVGATVLCNFQIRGMMFFAQGTFQKSVGNDSVIRIPADLFKSEKRSSYRLLTYPVYEVWASFDLGETYVGGKVVDLRKRTSETALFKSFLNLVSKEEQANKTGILRLRVQDISATGMAIHIGELEKPYFEKDVVYKDVVVNFQDETLKIPEVKIMYVLNYVSGDKNLRKFKVGLHFLNLPTALDDLIGKKINQLLRDSDSNKDFENLIK